MTLKFDIHCVNPGACLSKLYIMAFTSDRMYAESNDPPAVQLQARGSSRSVTLYDLPADQYKPSKGDLWKINFSDFQFEGCVRVEDITSIAIVATGTDGWNIDSIATYVANYDGKFQIISQDFDVYRWVDKNGDPSRKQFDLTLLC